MDNEKNEKLSLLAELVKLARADKEVKQAEYDFLSIIAMQLKITPKEFKTVFEENIEFQPPKLEVDRILQFQRLVLLMQVDQSIDNEELLHIREMGIRMGLNPVATNKVLEVMHQYENGIVPPDELIAIFKTFHN